MEKLKKAILGKDRWNGLNSNILLIEQNKESNPNVALDGAKSVLESIAKTILADKNIVYDGNASVGHLVKQAFNALPVFLKISSEDADKARSILGSFENISKSIGEFRNTHGFFSHGHDLQSEKFDRYLLELSISASDLLASFLIVSHAEDLKDRSRIYYEEYEYFNRYIDETSEQYPVVRGIQLTPSLALFTDENAYKEELLNFENNKEDAIEKLEQSGSFTTTHIAISELEEFKNHLSKDEITKILQATVNNQQINRLIGDEDVKQFISDLFQDKSDILDAQLKIQIENLLGQSILVT